MAPTKGEEVETEADKYHKMMRLAKKLTNREDLMRHVMDNKNAKKSDVVNLNSRKPAFKLKRNSDDDSGDEGNKKTKGVYSEIEEEGADVIREHRKYLKNIMGNDGSRYSDVREDEKNDNELFKKFISDDLTNNQGKNIFKFQESDLRFEGKYLHLFSNKPNV